MGFFSRNFPVLFGSFIIFSLFSLQFFFYFEQKNEYSPTTAPRIKPTKKIFPYHLSPFERSYACKYMNETFDSAIVTLHGRFKERLLYYIPSWQKLTWIIHKYPVIIFYDSENPWVTKEFVEEFQKNSPALCSIFFPVKQTFPDGYIWCSYFLSIEMYEHPAIEYLEYLIRFDDDVLVEQFAFFDIFQDMKENNISVGWKQNLCDNGASLMTRSHLIAYNWYQNKTKFGIMNQTDSFNLVWKTSIPKNTTGRSLLMWHGFDHNLFYRSSTIAGVVEMYKIEIFRSDLYREYAQLMKPSFNATAFTEQITKTMWMEMLLPLSKFKFYACALSVFHKVPNDVEHWFFHSHCDYSKNQLKNPKDRKHCDLDPQMRIC